MNVMRKIFIIILLSVSVSLLANDSLSPDSTDLSQVNDSAMVLSDSAKVFADNELTASKENFGVNNGETAVVWGMSKEDITIIILFVGFWLLMMVLARSSRGKSHYTTAGRSTGSGRYYSGGNSFGGFGSGHFDGSGASGKW